MSTVVKEDAFDHIIDFINKIRTEGKDKNYKYFNGSISNYVNNLTMSFPMMCDDTISIKTATMICQANEVNVASMLQRLFSSMSLKGENGLEIIRKAYKGIKGLGPEEMIDFLDNLVIGESSLNESSPVAKAEMREILKQIKEELANPKFANTDFINEKSLNDYTVYKTYRGINIRENTNSISEAKTTGKDKNDKEEEEKKEKDPFDDKVGDKMPDGKHYIANSTAKITSMEVKKQNQLQPTLIQINFVDTDSGKYKIENSFIAGVKSRLISVGQDDIIDRISSKAVSNKGGLFGGLIKFTTGELKLSKSIGDAIQKNKIKAKNTIKRGSGSRMWDYLETRGLFSSVDKITKYSNDASAITGLTISQETVNFIKSNYDFDLERPKNAKTIMANYNLMSIFIADEANEIVKSMYHGNMDYEILSYSALQKETDNSYKKVINLLNNMGR